jgi:hypothetical protein
MGNSRRVALLFAYDSPEQHLLQVEQSVDRICNNSLENPIP